MSDSITFAIPPVSVGKRRPRERRVPHSLNHRMHWAERYRWNRAWKEAIGWEVLARRKRLPPALPLPRCRVGFTLYAVHLYDAHDNLPAAVKPLVDGLKVNGGCGLIADDAPGNFECSVSQVRVNRKSDERVELTIAW